MHSPHPLWLLIVLQRLWICLLYTSNSFFGGAIGGGVFGAGATMIGSLRGGRGGTNENRQGHIPLTDEDLAEYLQTGKRQSTRNKKNRMVEEGQSPILTTAQSITSFIKDAISGKTKHVTKAYEMCIRDRLSFCLNALISRLSGFHCAGCCRIEG